MTTNTPIETRIHQDTFAQRRTQLLAAGYDKAQAAAIAEVAADDAVKAHRANQRLLNNARAVGE